MENKKALGLRKAMKSKRPNFVRNNIYKRVKLKYAWRKPKGRDSKLQRKVRGYGSKVSQGYRSPVIVRGLHPTGLRPVLVHNVNNLQGIGKDDGILIGHGVGMKKRIEIIKKAEEKKIVILNVKDAKAYLNMADEEMKKKKDKKAVADKDKKKAAEKKPEALAEKIVAQEKTLKDQTDASGSQSMKLAEKREIEKALIKK